MDLQLIILVLIILSLAFTLKCVASHSSHIENFEMSEPKDGNPFCRPLGEVRYKNLPDGLACSTIPEALEAEGSRPLCIGKDPPPAGPIVPVSCNRIPLWKPGVEPKPCHDPIEQDIAEAPFPALTPSTGQFAFCIPQWKFDGIWTKNTNPENPTRCCWSLESKPTECGPYHSYAGEHLSRVPECSLYGKTVISPPECAGLWPSSKPPITYVYDCAQDLPCDARQGVKCPTRV